MDVEGAEGLPSLNHLFGTIPSAMTMIMIPPMGTIT